MSSLDFDTAYDSIVSRIAALLPNHKRLRDPYNLEQNPDDFLKQGWGLSVGGGGLAGENTKRFTGCIVTTRIYYQLAITRKSYALDLDPANKAITDKNLLEDARVIIEDVWKNNFNIEDSPLIEFRDFSGISPVRVDKNSYLYVTMNLGAEYRINI